MEHIHPQMLKQLKERAARCTELEKAAADLVAELRGLTSEYRESHSMHSQSMADGFDTAADLVAEKLGLTPER